MRQDWRGDFERFAQRKTAEAASAQIAMFSTIFDRSGNESVKGVGNDWSRAHYGGDFSLFQPSSEAATALSLVFVQSEDRNTGGDPAALGGGATDTHLIYEGLSRVAADAVLSGAGITRAGGGVLSVWHPELIQLRESLGRARHPVQIVATLQGLDLDRALLFNVPDISGGIVTMQAGR